LTGSSKVFDASQDIELPPGVSYLQGDGMNPSVKISFPNRRPEWPSLGRVRISEVQGHRQEFIDDMVAFAIEWTKRDWVELMNCMSASDFEQIRFGPMPQKLSDSSLTTRFSKLVIDLKRLLIHQAKYISFEHRNEVPESLWDTISHFMSIEEATRAILSAIVVTEPEESPTFEIVGEDPLIVQVSRKFQELGPDKFRGRNEVWQVQPPDDQFLTKLVASIFEPAAQLMVAVSELYVPWSPVRSRSQFTVVGVLMGVIIRTQKYQRFPFAQLVWKYLAGEVVGDEDIIAMDPELKALYDQKHRRGIGKELKWEVNNWNGETITLPGHDEDPLVDDLSLYIDECVTFKRKELNSSLRAMKQGLKINLGISQHKLMTADVLQRLVTGQ
jgi:hypothetical protein